MDTLETLVASLRNIAISTPEVFAEHKQLYEAVLPQRAPVDHVTVVLYDIETPMSGGKHRNKTVLELAAMAVQISRTGVVSDLGKSFEAKIPHCEECKVIRTFCEYVASLKTQFCILIAHNGKSFDTHVLQGALKRHGQHLPRDTSFADTLYLGRQLLPGLSNHKLDTLAAAAGHRFAPGERHTAAGDVRGLLAVLKLMVSKNPQEFFRQLALSKETLQEVRVRVWKKTQGPTGEVKTS